MSLVVNTGVTPSNRTIVGAVPDGEHHRNFCGSRIWPETAGGTDDLIYFAKHNDKEIEMRTKYIAVACGLLIAGTALAFNFNSNGVRAGDSTPPAPTTSETATVETDNCCLTGDCCCPGQGDCCDPAVKAKAATSGVKYVKKAGAGCCATGNCCCPGQGSCCDLSAVKAEATSCCSEKAEKKSCCTK